VHLHGERQSVDDDGEDDDELERCAAQRHGRHMAFEIGVGKLRRGG
jgi:hypothetical protein